MRLALAVVFLLAASALAGCANDSPGTGPAGKVGGSAGTDIHYLLTANLTPPTTTFIVETTSFVFLSNYKATASSAYTYAWTNSNGCGNFTPEGPQAVWNHGEETNCSHAGPIHAGTITVVVGDLDNTTSSTGYMTCEYTGGSASGSGDACFVSSIAPAGQPKARPVAIPAPGVALLVAALGIAWWVRRA